MPTDPMTTSVGSMEDYSDAAHGGTHPLESMVWADMTPDQRIEAVLFLVSKIAKVTENHGNALEDIYERLQTLELSGVV